MPSSHKAQPTSFSCRENYYTTVQGTGADNTDEVPGIVKTAGQGIELTLSLVNAINLGLDSYLDTRLAMVLYRAVYVGTGGSQVVALTSLLLSALEKNPHNVEAWNLIIANVAMGVLTDVPLIEKAYQMLKAQVEKGSPTR